MGTINYLQAIKPDTAYIRKIINAGLLFDWVIRIEYQEAAAECDGWQLWDQTFFALRSAEPVVESLMTCYTSNAEYTIRIKAEKIRPQTQFLLTVYTPGLMSSETQDRDDVVPNWSRRERDAATARSDLIS